MKEGGQCTSERLVLVIMVLVGVSTSLLVLSIYLYLQNKKLFKRLRGPPGCEEPLSVLLTDKCRINSFTFLELAEAEGKRSQQSKDNLSVLSDSKSYKRDKDKQVLFQKINESKSRPALHYAGFASSKLSVGMSNSVSHSSYNSANEELEFDLYDYDNQNMLGDASDNTANSIDENFSMSELAPRKLFDSKDTIVNIADEILDNSKLTQNSFGTPVILRRGNLDSRRQIESITSDLTSSIISELSQYSHISQEMLLKDPETKNRNSNATSFIMCFDTDSINTATEINIKEENDQQNKIGYIDNVKENKYQEKSNNNFESHFIFPPIAQMDEFDLSDSDSL